MRTLVGSAWRLSHRRGREAVLTRGRLHPHGGRSPNQDRRGGHDVLLLKRSTWSAGSRWPTTIGCKGGTRTPRTCSGRPSIGPRGRSGRTRSRWLTPATGWPSPTSTPATSRLRRRCTRERWTSPGGYWATIIQTSRASITTWAVWRTPAASSARPRRRRDGRSPSGGQRSAPTTPTSRPTRPPWRPFWTPRPPGRGRTAAARALAVFERTFGQNHYEVAVNLHNLAAMYHRRGEPGRAEGLYRRALDIKQDVLGADHPDLATTLSNLALARHEIGDHREAQNLVERAIAILDTVVEPDHPTLVNCHQLHARLESELPATAKTCGTSEAQTTSQMRSGWWCRVRGRRAPGHTRRSSAGRSSGPQANSATPSRT